MFVFCVVTRSLESAGDMICGFSLQFALKYQNVETYVQLKSIIAHALDSGTPNVNLVCNSFITLLVLVLEKNYFMHGFTLLNTKF